jgi:hypothetical protein
MAIRILKSRPFSRWAVRESIADSDLCLAAEEIERGLIDAKLGGFLLKKRIARKHSGKSGGFRTIVAYRQGSRLFFLFGFAKSERANIDKEERNALLKLGDAYISMDDRQLARLIQEEKIFEVDCDG